VLPECCLILAALYAKDGRIMAKVTKSHTNEETTVYDDLTAIKGIREARQQWFRDTMKVHTYRDLAALSVDGIESGLKAEKQFPSRSMIAAWIAQAKALAEAVEQQMPVVKRQVVSASPSWTSQASFVIEFQVLKHGDGSHEQRMTIHHIETDKNNIWWGIEPEEAIRWMLAEAGIEVTVKPIVEPAALTPVQTASAYQSNYSGKLQQILAKSQQLSQSALPSEALATEHTASQVANAPSRPTGFSDRMQEVLARTQRY
jgi:hypothetical protein